MIDGMIMVCFEPPWANDWLSCCLQSLVHAVLNTLVMLVVHQTVMQNPLEVRTLYIWWRSFVSPLPLYSLNSFLLTLNSHQILFLFISDSSDSFDRPDPPKVSRQFKSRPSFSADQVQTLKSVFAYKHYIGKAECKQLAADLNMTDEQVKSWFQNNRTKLKKKMSRVDEHYAQLMYLNDIANSLPRDRLSPPGYHSYHNGFPVVRRTVDSRLPYL